MTLEQELDALCTDPAVAAYRAPLTAALEMLRVEGAPARELGKGVMLHAAYVAASRASGRPPDPAVQREIASDLTRALAGLGPALTELATILLLARWHRLHGLCGYCGDRHGLPDCPQVRARLRWAHMALAAVAARRN